MKLWSPIKNECYSRHVSVLKIYMGEKALGRANCVSEYVWPGELLLPQVFTVDVILVFSNAKIYGVNSMYFRRGKLIVLEVLLVWGLYCFSCGIGVAPPGEEKVPGSTYYNLQYLKGIYLKNGSCFNRTRDSGFKQKECKF